METSKEGQSRFMAKINRSLRESSHEDHPTDEEIFMFALGALSESRCSEMEKHLEFCCYCGEVFADAELMGEEFIRNLDPEIPIPTFAEFCNQREDISPNRGRSQDVIFVPKRHPERTEGATGKSRPETPAAVLAWRSAFIRPAGVLRTDGETPGTALVTWNQNGVDRKSPLTLIVRPYGYEIYSPDEALVDRTLTVRAGGKALRGTFKLMPVEGQSVRAYLKAEEPDNPDGANGFSVEIS